MGVLNTALCEIISNIVESGVKHYNPYHVIVIGKSLFIGTNHPDLPILNKRSHFHVVSPLSQR
jgi:hypothetical protein